MKRCFAVILHLFLISFGFGQDINIRMIDSLVNNPDIYRPNPKKGLRITDSLYAIASRLNNDTLLIKATYCKGMPFYYLGSYDSALYYWEKTVELCNRYPFPKKLGDCKHNMGKIYELQGKFYKANDNYIQSLQIFDRLNLQDRVANTLNVIGSLNTNLENLDIAQQYYNRALEIYTKIRKETPDNRYIQLGYAITHNNLGGISSRKKDFKTALFHFEKAKKLFAQLQDSFYLAFTLNNLGIVNTNLGNIQMAELYFAEAGKHKKSFENIQIYLSTLSSKGDLMLKQNKPLEAIKYFKDCQRIADSNNFTQIQLNNLQGLSNAYKLLSDYKHSLYYYEQFTNLKDSLLSESKYKQIMELQTMYETEKKEKIIIQKDRQLKRQIFTFSVAIFLIISVLIILFVFYRTREIRRRYKLENELNQSTQKALISQMNPHFIFNALNSVQLFILKNDKISSNLFLTNFADLIRKVLDNSRFQFITLYDELETLKAYMELEKARFSNKFDYVIVTPDNISLMDYFIPAMILQPFVENAIWHGFSTLEGAGKIRIEVMKQNAHGLQIIIEDNGVGRKKAEEIMAKNGKVKKSYGTKLVEERLRLYNRLNKSDLRFEYQDICDETGNCKGTKVYVYLSTNFNRK